MVLKPPLYPTNPQDILTDEKCDYCHRKGKECLNVKHGRFCVAIVYRYYRANRRTYDGTIARMKFENEFFSGSDRMLYEDTLSINMNETHNLPGCVESRSLIFALNLIEWEVLVKDVHEASGFW